MQRKRFLAVPLICMFLLAACEGEKSRSIRLAIEDRQQQKQLVSQRLVGLEEKISSLEVQRDRLLEDLKTYNNSVEAYMMDHKLAIICMAALNVSLAEDNEYSEEVKNLAEGATIVCAAGVLLDSDFRKEIMIVFDKLIQADKHAKDLRSQIASIQSKIDKEKTAAAGEQSEFDRLRSEIQGLQTQLSQL